MTTPEQWAELVEWVGDRFPNRPWAAEEALAYFYDIEEFDASDVWAGLLNLYEAGRDFAPNGSMLRAKAIEERRRSARDELYNQPLPAPAEAPKLPAGEPIAWDRFSSNRFGEVLTPQQVIERIHAERPCKTETCPIHFPVGA